MLKESQVQAHQQETEWTCSAACLKAALWHLGYDLPESDLAQLIGAREGRGAETTEIVEAAQKIGLDSWEQSFETLEDAIEVLQQGIPIIADVQSFNHPGKGHYVLIAGYYPDKGFIIMDPNTKGKTAVDNWRVIPDEQMEEIWWDRAMAPPHDLMPKWGVMVRDLDTEKMANGDMLQYFHDNPKKYEEYLHRKKLKEKKKEAEIQLGAFFNELEKIGTANLGTSRQAMLAGAQILGILGGLHGLAKGSVQDENGETNRLSQTLSGATQGALLGALIALGLHRNAVGKTTIPNLSKNLG